MKLSVNVIDMFGGPDRPRDKPPPKPRRPTTEVLDPRLPPERDPETLDIFTANGGPNDDADRSQGGAG